MKRLFLEEYKMRMLQESIGFLDTYLPDGNENVIVNGLVGVGGVEDKPKTEYLRRLGQLNLERKQLIELLMSTEPKPSADGVVLTKDQIVELIQMKVKEFIGDAEGDMEFTALDEFRNWIKSNLSGAYPKAQTQLESFPYDNDTVQSTPNHPPEGVNDYHREQRAKRIEMRRNFTSSQIPGIKEALVKHLSDTPKFLQRCLNIMDGKESTVGVGQRLESQSGDRENVLGPRGHYYSWVSIVDGVIVEIGHEEGNYAGGVVWSLS